MSSCRCAERVLVEAVPVHCTRCTLFVLLHPYRVWVSVVLLAPDHSPPRCGRCVTFGTLTWRTTACRASCHGAALDGSSTSRRSTSLAISCRDASPPRLAHSVTFRKCILVCTRHVFCCFDGWLFFLFLQRTIEVKLTTARASKDKLICCLAPSGID